MKISAIIFCFCFPALIVVLFTGCNSKRSGKDSIIDKLSGTWIWIETSGGIDGSTTKAADENAVTIEFGKDGTYKLFNYGKEKEKTQYSLSQGKSIYTTDSAWQIKYGTPGQMSSVMQAIIFKGDDTLFLNDECNDCMSSVYVRKK